QELRERQEARAEPDSILETERFDHRLDGRAVRSLAVNLETKPRDALPQQAHGANNDVEAVVLLDRPVRAQQEVVALMRRRCVAAWVEPLFVEGVEDDGDLVG